MPKWRFTSDRLNKKKHTNCTHETVATWNGRGSQRLGAIHVLFNLQTNHVAGDRRRFSDAAGVVCSPASAAAAHPVGDLIDQKTRQTAESITTDTGNFPASLTSADTPNWGCFAFSALLGRPLTTCNRQAMVP